MNGGRQLPAADTRAALTYAGEVATCRDSAELGEVLTALPSLIGSEATMVTSCSASSGEVVLESGDTAIYEPRLLAAVERSGGDHPVMADDFSRPGHGARRLSDFVGHREWARADLFNDFYKPLGMSHELSAQLSWGGPGSSCCLALHRSGGDFSERDRTLLELLAPHLRAARTRIDAAELAAQRLGLLSRDSEHPGQGTIVVQADGGLVAVSPQAKGLIDRWFGGKDDAVPSELDRWRRRRRAGELPGDFSLDRGERRLEARLLTAETTGGEDLIVLAEFGEELSAEGLARALPITSREGEVLALLAAGDTNDGIAHGLGISPHTVVRHVEHIYAKLGVHTRSGATRVALDARW